MLSLSEWLWIEQRQTCLLQITPACRARNGLMTPRRLYPDKVTSDSATLEHVWPRSRRSERPKDYPRMLVLACAGCNSRKGADLPTPDYVERARELYARWLVYRPDYRPEHRERKHQTRRIERVRPVYPTAEELERMDAEARALILRQFGLA
ncbi:MAG: HNH endonuclease domain-containing protein [Hyphomonadaceae bacterium]|nr:HNH endonuclease domain-containing protein [Hyphomonadaceae bacterium]